MGMRFHAMKLDPDFTQQNPIGFPGIHINSTMKKNSQI